jgi:GT2 family glycosyltransferase
MECSVVIVSYNVKEFLLSCIESVYRSDRKNIEIIVVDNNSSDGSLSLLKQKYPDVILIENKSNAGFSEANNQGIKIAKGDFIFLLNPDTKLRLDTISVLRKFLEEHADAGIVAPRLLNADGSLQVSAFKFPSLINIIAETLYVHLFFNIGNYSPSEFEKTFQPNVASGAALMFKRELINSIGYLDPVLFWMEDVDFCFRARAGGSKVFYLPGTEVIHYSGESQKKNLLVAISNQLISKLKFERKHGSVITFFFASFFILIHILSRLVVFFFASLIGVNYRMKRAAYFYALKKYFKFIFKGDSSIA